MKEYLIIYHSIGDEEIRNFLVMADSKKEAYVLFRNNWGGIAHDIIELG